MKATAFSGRALGALRLQRVGHSVGRYHSTGWWAAKRASKARSMSESALTPHIFTGGPESCGAGAAGSSTHARAHAGPAFATPSAASVRANHGGAPSAGCAPVAHATTSAGRVRDALR